MHHNRTALPRTRILWEVLCHILKGGRNTELSIFLGAWYFSFLPSNFGFPPHFSAPLRHGHWVALLDDPGISGDQKESQAWAGSLQGQGKTPFPTPCPSVWPSLTLGLCPRPFIFPGASWLCNTSKVAEMASSPAFSAFPFP